MAFSSLNRRFISACIGLAAAVLWGHHAVAQTYPSRLVTMIVPWPAGGPSDFVARQIQPDMQKALGQTPIIENVGGVGGARGVQKRLNGPADGYAETLGRPADVGYAPQAVAHRQVKHEIVRLWVASTDYSGDLNIDDKILARVVDGYRRIRNTLRFLLANTSDFDAEAHAVPADAMPEIDRWALARAAQVQDEIRAHFDVYEFHPVVARLQVFCSEDLGAFYLDVLKDRLYTTAAGSHARRSAQTALWHLTHAMLRWMAPFLSFTAEEAWGVFAAGKTSGTIFTETFWDFGGLAAQGLQSRAVGPSASEEALLARWERIRAVRDVVNKEIEAVRTAGGLGSSLQAEVTVHADATDLALLDSLGADLKFVLITSAAAVAAAAEGEALHVEVRPSAARKCERCWHWRDDVGHDPAHPTICGRCTSNLHGAGEARAVA